MKRVYEPLPMLMNGRYAVLYQYAFGKRKLLERFGRMFCYSDIIQYGQLHNIDFRRTQTLCQGGEMCD